LDTVTQVLPPGLPVLIRPPIEGIHLRAIHGAEPAKDRQIDGSPGTTSAGSPDAAASAANAALTDVLAGRGLGHRAPRSSPVQQARTKQRDILLVFSRNHVCCGSFGACRRGKH
jgi:hypothetical protein